jgi:hypothetical protein
MQLIGTRKRALRCALCCMFLGTLAMLTACGGSTPQQQVGLPTQPPPGLVNTYIGGQGNSPSQQSPWSVTIDHTKNVYSYTNPNPGSTGPTTGAFAPLTGGFLVLLGPNGYQNGLALEVPGDAIILRPGDSTTAPVFAVQQPSCFAIGGNVKFLFAFSPGLAGEGSVIPGSPQPESFYGRIYASTSSDGGSWQFNNQSQYNSPLLYASQGVPSDADYPGYLSGYPGTCSASSGSTSVTSSPLQYFDNNATYTVPTQYVISPGGFFYENQSYVNVPPAQNWSYPAISAWGVSEPSVPLRVGVIASVSYVGFLFQTAGDNSIYRTQLVGFGNNPISGTTMTGGTFPNEDPTQVPNLNMSVTFGTEDPLNNGVFYLAKLTTPNDAPTNFTDSCLSYGVSQTGSSTCTNDGVAIVGLQNGLYTIIMSASDTSGNQETLVLFQQ